MLVKALMSVKERAAARQATTVARAQIPAKERAVARVSSRKEKQIGQLRHWPVC
jgi:hypothetical protein